MDDKNKNIHKYFEPGDIITNEEVWGCKRFRIRGLGGNWYCPLLYCYPEREQPSPGTLCNILVSDAKLIDSDNRPFRRLSEENLKKLISKGNKRAIKEFLIRNKKNGK